MTWRRLWSEIAGCFDVKNGALGLRLEHCIAIIPSLLFEAVSKQQ
jgi:hypothetical protein